MKPKFHRPAEKRFVVMEVPSGRKVGEFDDPDDTDHFIATTLVADAVFDREPSVYAVADRLPWNVLNN